MAFSKETTIFVSVLVLALALLGFLLPVSEHADEGVYGIVKFVYDGDTVLVDIGGKSEQVRYIGIDTPEIGRDGAPSECFAEEAFERNKELVLGSVVHLTKDKEDRDKYGRLLRYVYVEDLFINEVLVSEGFATTLSISPNEDFADAFKEVESRARDASLGLWSACRP